MGLDRAPRGHPSTLMHQLCRCAPHPSARMQTVVHRLTTLNCSSHLPAATHTMLPHAGPAEPSRPAAAAAAAGGSRSFAAAAAAGGAGASSSSAAASKAAAAAFARQQLQQQQQQLPGELSVSWGDLPPDVRSSILSQLTPQDLARAASTCGEFRDWANAMRAHVRLFLVGWGPAASLTCTQWARSGVCCVLS